MPATAIPPTQGTGNLATRSPGRIPTPIPPPGPSRHVGRTMAPDGVRWAGDSHSVPVCRTPRSPLPCSQMGLSP